MMRVSSIVSSSWPGRLAKAGETMNVGTSHGAASHMTADRTMRPMTRTFITLEATCQASFSRSFAR